MNRHVLILILGLMQAASYCNAQGHASDDAVSFLKDLFDPDSRTNDFHRT